MLPACTEKVEWRRRRRRRRNQIETHLAYLHLQRTESSVSEQTFYQPKEHTGAYKQQSKLRNFGVLALRHSGRLLTAVSSFISKISENIQIFYHNTRFPRWLESKLSYCEL